MMPSKFVQAVAVVIFFMLFNSSFAKKKGNSNYKLIDKLFILFKNYQFFIFLWFLMLQRHDVSLHRYNTHVSVVGECLSK